MVRPYRSLLVDCFERYSNRMTKRPETDEAAPYYFTYIDRITTDDVRQSSGKGPAGPAAAGPGLGPLPAEAEERVALSRIQKIAAN